MTQLDRMERPTINTVFNHGDDKNTFNRIQPTQDRALFSASLVATLEGFGYSTADAQDIADILLPDILTYDYSSSLRFLKWPRAHRRRDRHQAESSHEGSDRLGLRRPSRRLQQHVPYLGPAH